MNNTELLNALLRENEGPFILKNANLKKIKNKLIKDEYISEIFIAKNKENELLVSQRKYNTPILCYKEVKKGFKSLKKFAENNKWNYSSSRMEAEYKNINSRITMNFDGRLFKLIFTSKFKNLEVVGLTPEETFNKVKHLYLEFAT